MPERPSKKVPTSILEEADGVLEKEQFGKSRITERWPDYQCASRQTLHARYVDFAGPLLQNWLEIYDKARSFPRSEFLDDITELRRDTNVLRANMEVLRGERVSTKNKVEELSQEVVIFRCDKRTETVVINELCKAYIEEVKNLDVVREVLLSKSEDDYVSIIWTVIEGSPFEDSLRIPIYEAQLRILKSLKEDALLDFHVINLSELSENQIIEDIVPPDIDVLWHR